MLEADEIAKEKKSVAKFMEFYAPKVAKRYDRIRDLFKSILLRRFSAAVEVKDPTLLHKELVGLFMGMHESSAWKPRMYTLDSPSQIIDLFVKKTIKEILDTESWESPTDPLHTSVLDGRTAMTDEEIVTYFKEQVNQRKISVEGIFHSINGIEEPILKEEEIDATKVKRTSRFIDVSVRMKTGKKYKHAFTTLKHKILNSVDHLNLMKYAGEEKAPFTSGFTANTASSEATRIKAQEYLSEIQSWLVGAVTHFGTMAKLTLEEDRSENSFGTLYEKWSQADHAETERFKKEMK